MEIKLKKEEEDRQARRKRVEAIMLRTRGKGTTPTNTPTKVFLLHYFYIILCGFKLYFNTVREKRMKTEKN